LLKNRNNLKTQEQRQHLKDLPALNETINTVMILKEKLKHIWTYRSRAWAAKAVDEWCALARSVNNHSVNAFAKTLERYRYESPRDCRRLHSVRGWGHETAKQVFPRGS